MAAQIEITISPIPNSPEVCVDIPKFRGKLAYQEINPVHLQEIKDFLEKGYFYPYDAEIKTAGISSYLVLRK